MTQTISEHVQQLVGQMAAGDRRALSRLVSRAALGDSTEQIREALKRIAPANDSAHARVIAITGSGGVGKSTLIGRLVEHLRQKQESVAVLACDPSSSLTGGALLGDRIRMATAPEDEGIFIRSLAVPSGHQAIAEHLDLMVELLSRFGFGYVLLETVGAGQGDTAVREVADVVVLLVQPEAGDEVQWEKAGLLEIADVVVVNKADLPGAQRVATQLAEMLNLPGVRKIPIELTSGARAEGIDALWATLGKESQ